MRQYFKGVSGKAADGWMLAVVTGNSGMDGQDWIIDTNSLHADQVPDCCNDAQLFSKFVAGLLNYYYNNGFSKTLTESMLIEMGTFKEEKEIPSPKNPSLPF